MHVLSSIILALVAVGNAACFSRFGVEPEADASTPDAAVVAPRDATPRDADSFPDAEALRDATSPDAETFPDAATPRDATSPDAESFADATSRDATSPDARANGGDTGAVPDSGIHPDASASDARVCAWDDPNSRWDQCVFAP